MSYDEEELKDVLGTDDEEEGTEDELFGEDIPLEEDFIDDEDKVPEGFLDDEEE